MPRPLFLDVELSRSGALFALAALGPDGQEIVANTAAEVPGALRQIDALVAQSDLLVGHNLARHDRPWLARYAPSHPALRLPWADTLVLSPLAFPERPYHRLIKEHKLVRESRPAPLADCRATRVVFEDMGVALAGQGTSRPALAQWCRAALTDPRCPDASAGYAQILGGSALLSDTLLDALRESLRPHACSTALDALTVDPAAALPLAYVASWMGVPPGSTLPAWVRHTWPSTVALVDTLRARPCAGCLYCDTQHSPEGWLRRMFGYDTFRPTPATDTGASLQRAIVAAGMEERALYAVLPTGTGKSLCFQIPAAARHRSTGALTVVISPLQSLMKDQVDQLRGRDPHATTINGSLTPPERARALDEVREGFTSLAYLSPEQLRNVGVRRALEARTIGAWVIDEAHCLTDWGHDFRTDYLYVPRFARELAAAQGRPIPPFQCFTGTSQVAVTAAIRELFQAELGQDLVVFDGGAERDNLTFLVEERAGGDKITRLLDLLDQHLGAGTSGGAAIVFCATRKLADELGQKIAAQGWEAAAYHAGLDAQVRRDIQDRFLQGGLRVITATSAFGMGVDKPNVRLVVHLDVPGSLEAYLQQAGRAGRDREPATCVLLFAPGDVDKQFRMATQGQLSLRDLQALWRGIQQIPASRGQTRDGLVDQRVLTRGEIARLDAVSRHFDPHDPMTDTRITAAVSWLERAGLFKRDENHTHVFQGKPRYPTLDEAAARVVALDLPPARAHAWMTLLRRLYAAEADEGLSADELAEAAEQDTDPVGGGSRVLVMLDQMVKAGLLTAGVQLTAFVSWGVPDPSRERGERLLTVQRALLRVLPESAPDANRDTWAFASPPALADKLAMEDELDVHSDRITLLLRALERDGLGLSDEPRSVDLRFARKDELAVRVRRPWAEVERLGKLRSEAVTAVLGVLDGLAAQAGTRGKAVRVAFDLADLVRALESNLLLSGQMREATALVDQSLLLLHDARVITLQGGLAVFRQAMVLRRTPDAPRTLKADAIAPLQHHQEERTLQIHVVHEYARLGTNHIEDAQALTRDWFEAPRDLFLKRWFAGRRTALGRATTEESFQAIVEVLDPTQRKVVTTSPDANLLVLAGPGSGKTRVLVHRVAWLVRVKQVRPEGILVVCYTRANALELRRRLAGLIEKDARGVTVTTLHGLALRLTARSARAPMDGDFDALIDDAIAILKRERVPDGADASEIRDLVLRGCTHLLVDEYQDLDERQVRLLEAIAGRDEADADQRLAFLAVGDDDQSIFGWRGGSAKWVREFGDTWKAERHVLGTCYRCSVPILAAASAMIAPVADRLKAGTQLEVATTDADSPRSVVRWWPRAEQVGARVVERVQAALAAGAAPSDIAVLARTRVALAPVRAALEASGIPVCWPLSHDENIPLPRVREVSRLLDALGQRAGEVLDLSVVASLIEEVAPSGRAPGDAHATEPGREPHGPWRQLLDRWLDDVLLTHGPAGAPAATLEHTLWELLTTERGDRTLGTGVRLGTLHGAKGLEWPRVILVDDGDGARDAGDDGRRLLYVGMTRAKRHLDLLVRRDRPHPLLTRMPDLVVSDNYTDTSVIHAIHSRYELLKLEDLWIDWLGRQPSTAAAHATLEALPFGAVVTLEPHAGGLRLVAAGVPIAAIKSAAQARWQERAGLELRFIAAVRRDKEQSDPEYQALLRVDRWWLPVCEGRW